MLPFTIDHPIEHLIEEGFDTFWLEGFRQGHEAATDGIISTGGENEEEQQQQQSQASAESAKDDA